MAGELIGLQMGLPFAGLLRPAGGHGQPGGPDHQLGLDVSTFVAINGPLALLATVIESFSVAACRQLGRGWWPS
jgi:flagellar biosynthesis protein FliR